MPTVGTPMPGSRNGTRLGSVWSLNSVNKSLTSGNVTSPASVAFRKRHFRVNQLKFLSNGAALASLSKRFGTNGKRTRAGE